MNDPDQYASDQHARQYAPGMVDVLSQTLSISTANESSFHSEHFPQNVEMQETRPASFTAHSPIDTASPGSAGCPPSPLAQPRASHPETRPASASLTVASSDASSAYARITATAASALRPPAPAAADSSPTVRDLAFMLPGSRRPSSTPVPARPAPPVANISSLLGIPRREHAAARAAPSAAAGPARTLTKRPAKRHTCTVCNKSFKRAHNLKIHGRLHTDEMPFACNEAGCGKAFKWKSSIVSHTKWHAKLKGQKRPAEGPTTAAEALRLPGRKQVAPRVRPARHSAPPQTSAPMMPDHVRPVSLPPTLSELPLLPPIAGSPTGSAASVSAPPPPLALTPTVTGALDGGFNSLVSNMSPPLRSAAEVGFSIPPTRAGDDMPGLLRFSNCSTDFLPDPESPAAVRPLGEAEEQMDASFDGFAFLKDEPV